MRLWCTSILDGSDFTLVSWKSEKTLVHLLSCRPSVVPSYRTDSPVRPQELSKDSHFLIIVKEKSSFS